MYSCFVCSVEGSCSWKHTTQDACGTLAAGLNLYFLCLKIQAVFKHHLNNLREFHIISIFIDIILHNWAWHTKKSEKDKQWWLTYANVLGCFLYKEGFRWNSSGLSAFVWCVFLIYFFLKAEKTYFIFQNKFYLLCDFFNHSDLAEWLVKHFSIQWQTQKRCFLLLYTDFKFAMHFYIMLTWAVIVTDKLLSVQFETLIYCHFIQF